MGRNGNHNTEVVAIWCDRHYLTDTVTKKGQAINDLYLSATIGMMAVKFYFPQ